MTGQDKDEKQTEGKNLIPGEQVDPGGMARTRIERQIAALEARLAEFKRRLPAHSIPPGMIAELDELDDELAERRAELAALEAGNKRE